MSVAIDDLLGMEIFPGDSSRMSGLYQKVCEHSGLKLSDFLLIRDLLRSQSESIDPADARIHLLMILLFQTMRDKNSCLSLLPKELEKQTRKLKLEEVSAKEILQGIESGEWRDLMSDSPETPLRLANHHLYVQRQFDVETALGESLRSLLDMESDHAPEDIDRIRGVMEHCLGDQGFYLSDEMDPEKMLVLSDEQRLAVIVSLLRPFTLICGGPGTGKTSIVAAILRCWSRERWSELEEAEREEDADIVLCAPTGRAAKRLYDSVMEWMTRVVNKDESDEWLCRHSRASTLHSLLRYRPSMRGFAFNRKHKLSSKLIVVDEVSMVDMNLMQSLLEAVESGRGATKLLFLGDPRQLPSVETGCVLSDMLPLRHAGYSRKWVEELNRFGLGKEILKVAPDGGGADQVVMLSKSFRSERGLQDFANSFVKGEEKAISSLTKISADQGKNMKHEAIEIHEDLRTLDSVMLSWMKNKLMGADDSYVGILRNMRELGDLGNGETQQQLHALFDRLDGFRVLALQREFGSVRLNLVLSEWLRRQLKVSEEGGWYHGLPIMVTRNDASQGLSNGDVGIVLRQGTELGVLFYRGGKFEFFLKHQIRESSAALAMTVHKSQGSEYREVCLVMPADIDHPLLTREMVYTAVTRAKKHVLILGEMRALEKALKTPLQRYSGIRLWQPTEVG